MTRVWFAAILGVLLGLGIAYTPVAPVASPSNARLPVQPFEVQRQIVQPVSPARSDSQLVLISLLAGLVVAAPVFLVTKQHT